ncbi:MAG: PIG-L family deacetylase [Acidimicrobiia bacterium]
MQSDTHDQIAQTVESLSSPAAVLTIGAHPDDAEFGAGATLSRWTTDGATATIVIATDGSKGSWDPGIADADLIAQRRSEQMSAAAVLGASSITWLGQPDGELRNTPALRKVITQQIRKHRPDVVLTHDPWQRYQLHPDHRAAGLVAIDAVVAAREPRFYPDQGLDAHRPTAVLLWSADDPDHAEPVDDRAFDAKVEALLCHTSQSETTMGNAAASDAARERFVRQIDEHLRQGGEAFGLDRAETFKRLTP